MAGVAAGLGTSTLANTQEAVRQAVNTALTRLGGARPGLAYVTCTVEHQAAAVLAALQEALPWVPVHGATTSLGVLGSTGVLGGPHGAVGILLLAASGGASLAVGSAPLQGDAREAGRVAARNLMDAGQGRTPQWVFFSASPGHEEDLLAGVGEVLPNVPAWGGSAADHAIAGGWSVFTNNGALTEGVSLAGVFGPVAMGAAFIAPYQPTGKTTRVTAARDRTLVMLDGRPAGRTLGDLLGTGIAFQVQQGGNILAQTSLRPLALERSANHFLTIHPASVGQPGNTVALFARVTQGATLCLMESTPERLVAALESLVLGALKQGRLAASQVGAGVLIYCAGCAGAVGGLLDEALKKHLPALLPGVPVLGLCTFGEQGHVPGLGNLHQNLTLGLVLMGRPT